MRYIRTPIIIIIIISYLVCCLDGTEEMIDAWLVFVEKLVNTKAILESPHSLPNNSNAEGFVPFKPIQFLIKAQKVNLACDLSL
jgi:hypothetical protein